MESFALESRALDALQDVLKRVSVLRVGNLKRSYHEGIHDLDALIDVEIGGAAQKRTLVVEVKANGQPKLVRQAILQLRAYVREQPPGSCIPVLIAPYLTHEVQALCRSEGVGYLDFEGNVWLTFDSVYIERASDSKPAVERRELKGLFSPKSSQVLGTLVADPERRWRLVDLADASEVSLGHVSNVRRALLERGWAEASDEGLWLSAADQLMENWFQAYPGIPGKQVSFYTTLHGAALDEAAKGAFSDNEEGSVGLVYRSFSAAKWLAPYARVSTAYFYADESGLTRLTSALRLESSSKGANVQVVVPTAELAFRGAVMPAVGIWCTSPLITYLDLTHEGERGLEAAAHLRREVLKL